MATIIPVERKSPVLNHPALPCLARWHTVNVMAGCPYVCRYCYAKSFRSHPGGDTLRFYSNTVTLLRKELFSKRIKPSVVYFSTACEPFPPIEEILQVQWDGMKLLLENGVSLLISTKSTIPDRFVNLLASYPGQSVVQVGLTTVDENLRLLIEPHAAAVQNRLKTLTRLCQQGISAEARLDPLIPELTDHESSIENLCSRIIDCGVNTVAVSYLFLRRAVAKDMPRTIGDWSFDRMVRSLYSCKIKHYCGNNSIIVPALSYRREKYQQIKQIANSHGIHLRLCHCKNPDVTMDCCHPSFRTEEKKQYTFDLPGE